MGHWEAHIQRFNGSAEAGRDKAGLTETTSDVL
jgi:hypothetical protein